MFNMILEAIAQSVLFVAPWDFAAIERFAIFSFQMISKLMLCRVRLLECQFNVLCYLAAFGIGTLVFA